MDSIPPAPPPPNRRAGPDSRFLCTVGILLLVIIAALTGLALSFHRRARLAETALAQANDDLRRLQVGTGLLRGPLPQMAELPRELLPRTQVQLDGRAAQVLEVDRTVGEMLGLEAGDILRVAADQVAPGAATQPATRPATQP